MLIFNVVHDVIVELNYEAERYKVLDDFIYLILRRYHNDEDDLDEKSRKILHETYKEIDGALFGVPLAFIVHEELYHPTSGIYFRMNDQVHDECAHKSHQHDVRLGIFDSLLRYTREKVTGDADL